jgi:serine/threonine-protein kinase PRP4
VIHGDLKPDNIMVSPDTLQIRICDFGNAFSIDENGITEYLASRFYRAPEILLGCPYGYEIDTWAIAVTLFELFTGEVMFPGNSNTEMLKLIMELKGKVNSRMMKKGTATYKHFNEQGQLLL